MKIQFRRTCSGCARRTVVTETMEVESYEVLPPGTPMPMEGWLDRVRITWGIRIPGKGTFELVGKVKEIK